MSEREKTLFDLRQRALSEARSLVDNAPDKVLSAEDEAIFQRHMDDWTRYDEALQQEKQLREREAAGAGQRHLFAPEGTPVQERGISLEEWMVKAVQTPGSHRCTVELVPDQFGSLKPEVRSFLGQREFRADTPVTSTDAATVFSSYAVPTLVAPEIEELKYAYSAVLRAGVNAITTEGINKMYIPKVVTNPTINDHGAENTAPANSSYPVLGRTELDGYRHDAFVVITEEDIASSSVDMMAFLNRTLMGSLAAQIAKNLIVGDGTGDPKGLQVAATTGVTTALATDFTADEVIGAYQSVAAQYRPGMKAVISQLAETKLAKLKNDNGDYIWRQGMVAGNPDTLLGVPLFVDPQGDDVAATKKPLVFFNPMNFHVRWCMGGRIAYDISTEAQFTQFNRVIRVAQWFDCDAGDAGGVKSLTMHA